MSRFAIFIGDANQGGSFPSTDAAEAAAKAMGLRPGQFEVKPKSTSPVVPTKGDTRQEMAADFEAEWRRREQSVTKRASAEVAEANAKADELAKTLAEAEKELAVFRAAAASAPAETDPKKSESPAPPAEKSDSKKK